MTDNDVVVTEQAAEVITRIGGHLTRMANALGEDHPLYTDSAGSWASAIGKAFGLLSRSGGRLYAPMMSGSDQLSLEGTTGTGFTFGVVFFRDRAFDDVRVDPTTWTEVSMCRRHRGQPLAMDTHACKEGALAPVCGPINVPVPGSWSLHS